MNASLKTTVVESPPRLYVDLDGSLIHTNLLLESIIAFVKSSPWRVLDLLRWLRRGREYLKARLAEQFVFDPATLPYDSEFLSHLHDLKRAGHSLFLTTASDQRLAARVAGHLGIFDGVVARADDVTVTTPVVSSFPKEVSSWRLHVRAIRAYQWAKNLLLFVPLITAHEWTNVAAILDGIVAFVAFSLCASSIYLLNDIFDLESDRAHPRKKKRPIASGRLSIEYALMLAGAMLAAGLALAAVVGPLFVLVAALYVVTTVAYSITLKTYVLIDVMTLASLYTFRIIGGAAAISVVPSFWLLAFSMFMFLSLALIKRCSELQLLQQMEQRAARGRDYRTSDIPIIAALGVASGFAAVQVFALYINSDEVAQTYDDPELLWLLCITILYWLGRMWIKTGRNQMHDDPLLFAARDRGSLVMLALSLLIVIVAT